MFSGLKVLIIDDDKTTRMAISRLISKRDSSFQCFEAGTFRESLALIADEKPDCIILDYVLEETDGLEILNNFNERNIKIPVIMLTGYGDEIIAVKALRSGAFDYIPKNILNEKSTSEFLIHSIKNAVKLFRTALEKQKAENELLKSLLRYRRLVDKSPVPIFRFFPEDYIINFVNDRFCEYFNTSQLKIVGDKIDQIIDDSSAVLSTSITNLTLSNHIFHYEHCIKGDEKDRWVLWTMQGLYDSKENLVEVQCIGEDITTIKESEMLLEKQKSYLQTVIDSQDNMIVVADDDNILMANHSYLDYFKLKGRLSCEKYDDNFYAPSMGDLINIKEKILSYSEELPVVTYSNDDKERFFSVSVSSLTESEHHYVYTFTDVTHLEERSRNLEKKANHDKLTGIYNRRKFEDHITISMHTSRRYGTPLSLIFFDIDHFKGVNDTHGHQMGDLILKELTFVVHEKLRKSDVFARWGGEEFVILLHHTDIEKAEIAAEKIRVLVKDLKNSSGELITCSFGVTQFTENDSVKSFIQRADDALYEAKSLGRDRVTVN
jgi:diguanylate cyclase (GGDEF)-like protein/PAS domain S-box-containing protein